jgi:hypothetical protein
MEENMEFRKGLPRNYLNFMGVAHSDQSSTQRTDFVEKVKSLMMKLCDHAPIDAAVDQMGKQFIHDALPPVLNAGKNLVSDPPPQKKKINSNMLCNTLNLLAVKSEIYLFICLCFTDNLQDKNCFTASI